MTEWISVKDEIPALNQLVRVLREGHFYEQLKLCLEKDDEMRGGTIYVWRFKSGILKSILDENDLWLPIPDAPREGG